MLASASPDFEFPEFDENTQATTFYTSGTTGAPKGVYFSHRQMVLHTICELAAFGVAAQAGPISQRKRLHADHADVSCSCMGHALRGDRRRREASLPGRYVPDLLLKLIKKEGVTFTHCVPTILLMMLDAPVARTSISAA